MFLSSRVLAQTFEFQNITQENGLPSSVITALYQDSRKFLWIGTDGAGLVRFDGSTYKVYDEGNGLEGSFVCDITEDGNTNLVIATKYEGIVVFNGYRFFKHYRRPFNPFSSNHFYKLIKTAAGVYCIGRNDIVLIKPDYSLQLIAQLTEPLDKTVTVAETKNGTLYIADNQGLHMLQGNKLVRVFSKELPGATALCKDSKQTLLIANESGKVFTLEEGKSKSPELKKAFTTPPGFKPLSLFVSKANTIWLGGEGTNRLVLYDGGTFSSFGAANGYTGEHINCFLQDKTGSLFIGTDGNGLFQTGQQLFVNYNAVPLLNNSRIFSVHSAKNALYVGIRGAGIYRFEKQKNESYKLAESYPNGVGANTLLLNRRHEMLAGTVKGVYLLKNGKQIQLLPAKRNDNWDVRVMKQDSRKGFYFVGTHGHGLFVFDSLLKQVSNLTVSDSLSNFVSSLDEVADGEWYVGTERGLFQIKRTPKGNFEVTSRLNKVVTQISTRDIYGNFWYAGTGCIYRVSKNGIKIFTRKDGLTSTLIYTLLADKRGNVWSGTNLGIDRLELNPEGEAISVTNYNFKNGFRGLETNMRAQYLDAEGNMFFGTARGLVKCLPVHNHTQLQEQEVFITNLKISNQSREWLTDSSRNKWLNLPDSGFVFKPNENQLTFQFSAINRDIYSDEEFSYKLEGVDKNWSNPGNVQEVSYNNLLPGKYCFKVRMVDISGVPIGREGQFWFSIAMPFYKSWWFIVGCASILCIVIIAIFNSFSSFNSDSVFDKSGKAADSELRLYVLCLGIMAPVTEVVIEIFKVRQNSELAGNLILGAVLLSVYYLSLKIEKVAAYLYHTILIATTVFFLSSAYKISTGNTEFLTISELFLVFFFSFILFKYSRRYWLYIVLISAFLLSLLINPLVPQQIALIVVNGSVFIMLMNYATHIGYLNSSEKILFANNIVHNGNSLTIATNRMGELVFCSRNIEKILGYTPDEVMGMGFWQLTGDKEFEHIDYSQKFVQDQVYTRKLKCKDGSYKFIQWTDTRHGSDLFVGIGQDVTAQVRIQEQYQNLVQNATDLIFETDAEGYFTFLNKIVTEVLGYKPEELIGRRFTDIVRPDYLPKMLRQYFVKNSDQNHFDILEFPIIARNGDEHWVSQKVNANYDENGRVTGYSSIVRDITKTKIIEIENNKRQEKRSYYSQVLFQLSTDPNTPSMSFDDAVKNMLNKAAEALQVDRMSIWRNNKDRIECTFETAHHNLSSYLGLERSGSKYPIYFNLVTEGTPIIMNDVSLFNNNTELRDLLPDNVKSILEIPVFANAEFNGVLSCEMVKSTRNWDEEDLNFARSVADVLSLLLETRKRQKIEKQLAFRNEISLAVAKITERLLKTDDLEETLRNHLDVVGVATRINRLYFYTFDPSDKTLRYNCGYLSDATKPAPDLRINLDELKMMAAYIRSNQLFEALDGKTDEPALTAWMASRSSLSTLIVPVYHRGGLYGIIGFDDCEKRRVWANSHLVILKAFSDNIATAIDRVLSEQKIKESENNFRQINETIQDVFWLYDYVAKKYLYVSPNSQSVLGIPAEAFYSGTYRNYKLVAPEDVMRRKNALESLSENDYYEVEYRLVGNDGETKWISEKSYAIRNEYGTLLRNSGTCRDITEKKKYEAELRQLSIVAEKTTNGVVISEANGTIIWANQGFLDMFETDLETVKGKSQRELFLPEDEILPEEIEELQSKNFTREVRMFTQTKKLKWIEVNCTKITDSDGVVIQRIEVLTDITEQVENRNILLSYSNDLEFQSSLQKKIINAQTYEQLTLETLGYIAKQFQGTLRISLIRVDKRTDSLSGHSLINQKLERVTYRASETRSFESLLRGETFIQEDLHKVVNKSTSDLDELAIGIQSYVILPIMNETELIGTLNIAFASTLALSSNQIRNLESFATLFSVALRQMDLKKELSVRNKNILDSMVYARYIQNALLTDMTNIGQILQDIVLFFKPKDIVSGDFYWAKSANGLTYIALADCTGHGVPGAFLTVLGSRLLEEIVVNEQTTDPGTILQKLDERIYKTLNTRQNEIIRDGMEIALCVIDSNTNTLRFSGSGRELVIISNNVERTIKGHRRVIGDFDRPGDTFFTTEINYNTNDIFFLFSDGYKDQLGGTNSKRYSRQRFIDLLKTIANLTPSEMEQALEKEFEKYKGENPQTDDVTVMSFKIKH